MFHTITIPATLYPAIVQATVEHFQNVLPGRPLAIEELNDDKLRSMRGSFARLGEIAAALDQLSWTTIPRQTTITAEGPLLRSILSYAIDNTLKAFTRAMGATITPDDDLDHYQRLNDQVAGLLSLVRPIQHDYDADGGAA
jgi:hypothetical protein